MTKSNHSKNQGKWEDNDFSKKFDPNWISQKITHDGILFTEKFGEFIANEGKGLTTSQIRNFFGEVKRIQLKGFLQNETSFLLLKPKLAYATQRSTKANKAKKETRQFKIIMDLAHDSVEPGNLKHFNNYVDFLEAILAYHKAFGGRE